MLQPVKGIELSEEDRGEMVPNMGIECASCSRKEFISALGSGQTTK